MDKSIETGDWLDTSLPLDRRVDDLLSRMTIGEKISQLLYKSAAIERLGIPAYGWWNECLHGISRNGKATIFPQAIGLASSFDTGLLFRVASSISDEARAKYHHRKKHGDGSTGKYEGLTFWSPNINIFRDPRWGRGQETYGEDPFLTSRLGAAYVRGLQGNDPEYLKTAACAKHFAVHSGPEKDRHRFNAEVSLKDLHETYLPAFKALVDAGVEAVMGAYNRTNGEPCCASRLLLEQILRDEWNFRGHVVSDCWAIRDFHEHHHVTEGPAESAALALKRGCDLNCGCMYESLVLEEALAKGLITVQDIDRSLRRLLSTRFRLGMFDPDESVPYSRLSLEVVDSEAHRTLAREAAVKSFVLLKNRNGILPLDPEKGSLLVTGPNAADLTVLMGNYHGLSGRLVTPLEGIAAAGGPGLRIDYKKGCLLAHPKSNPVDWTAGDAANRTAVIAVMGLAPELEGEEGDALDAESRGDREEIELPENQLEFLRVLCSSGSPVVLVLCGGSPVTLGGLEEKLDAILQVWYPGEEGGTALADVLFGRENPSGKLPVTFPRSIEALPPFEDYAMEGRTYRFLKDSPLFPFGFGLSYTSFSYDSLKLDSTVVPAGQGVAGSVGVTNSGSRAGEEIVQVYLSDLESSVRVPVASLCGFIRVGLQPGESKTVGFTILPDMMELVTEEGIRRLEPGEYLVTVGGASPCPRSGELGAPVPATAGFTLA